MLRRLLAILAASALAGTAQADLLITLQEVDNSAVQPGDDPAVPDFNDGTYFTFDLYAQPSEQDGWLGADLWATIDGPPVFFQHPLGGDGPPDPNQVALYPALEFDSYFTTPLGGQPWFVPGEPPDNQPTAITASWTWDGLPVEGAGGPFARITAQWLGGEPAALTLEGWCSKAPHGMISFSFTATIPEPSALILLAFGGFLFGRRR